MSRQALAQELTEESDAPLEPYRRILLSMMDEIRKGDWAYHRMRELDPREIVRVSGDQLSITLDINGHETPWLPAANYRIYRYLT